MKNKKAFLTLEQIVKLVLAILMSVLLIMLFVAIRGSVIKESSGDKTIQQVNAIYSELRTLNSENTQKTFTILQSKGWYLVTSDINQLCGGEFCLCLCKNPICTQVGEDEVERTCIVTDKYVSIRVKQYNDETRKERKYFKLEEVDLPLDVSLSFVEGKVYPYTDRRYLQEERYEQVPVFYNFFEEWRWSLDLEYWMKTSTWEVEGGVWEAATFGGVKQLASDKNRDVISTLDQYKDEEGGENFLESIRATESKGVYRIDV